MISRTLTALGCWLLLLGGAAVRAAEPEAATMAVELPSFQPGLWEFRRTIVGAQTATPQVSTVRKCADPTADIRAKMLALEEKRCQFVPLRKREDHYISSWTCPTPNGVTRFRDVLTVQGPTRYEDVSEAHSPNHVTQQKIEARRLGDCPAPAAAPAHAPKPPPQP